MSHIPGLDSVTIMDFFSYGTGTYVGVSKAPKVPTTFIRIFNEQDFIMDSIFDLAKALSFTMQARKAFFTFRGVL
jgi:hypothetical protein